jgi:hypothetical protein
MSAFSFQTGTWSLCHQTLPQARWSPLAVRRHRFLLLVESGVPTGVSVEQVMDRTKPGSEPSRIFLLQRWAACSIHSRQMFFPIQTPDHCLVALW